MRKSGCRAVPYLFSVSLVLMFLLPSQGFAKKSKKPPSRESAVVATMGDQVITKEQFLRYWDSVPQGRKNLYDREGGKEKFLEDLIRQKLLVMEAEKRGLHKVPKTDLEIELARDQILYRAMYNQAVVEKVIPEEDIKKYYEENKERYTIPEMIKARHILVTPKKDTRLLNELKDDAEDDESAKAKIKKIEKLLQEGGDFADLARKYSEGPTAPKGGDLGFFPRNRMVKPFEEAAFALEIGQISDVVKTNFGYHLILVEGKKPAGYRSLDEVRETIRSSFSRERKEQLVNELEAFVESLKKSYNVETAGISLEPENAEADK